MADTEGHPEVVTPEPASETVTAPLAEGGDADDHNGHPTATDAPEAAPASAMETEVPAAAEAPAVVEVCAVPEAETPAKPEAPAAVEPEAPAVVEPEAPVATTQPVNEVAVAAVPAGADDVEAMAEELLREQLGVEPKLEAKAETNAEPEGEVGPPPPLYEAPSDPVEPASETAAVLAAEERLMTVQYDWDQTEKTVNIRIDLPENVTARALQVTIKKDQLAVTIQDKPFVQWRLFQPVLLVEDEAQWTVGTAKDGKKVLDFDLPKEEQGMWHYLIKQPLPGSLLLPAEEVQRFIEEDLKSTPIQQPEGSGLVLGPDGIKRNPEVEPLSEEEKSLTAAQLYQTGLTHFRQGSTGFKEGLRLLRLCALHHDHADACLFLFEVYAGDTSYGPEKDIQAGLWFLRHGADRTEDMRIFVTLANNYEHGLLGLPQSLGWTIKWFQRAARRGHTTAISHLADILMQGKCIDIRAEANEDRKRPTLAKELLLHGQKRGCPQSYVTMGDCYLRDAPGFARDLSKAEACYEKARALYPELRSSIPTHELQLLKKAMEEAKAPRRPSEPQPEPEEDIPEISTALAQQPKKDRAFQDRVRRLEGQLMKAGGGGSQPSAPQMERSLWGGASFWEKAGTIAAGCALGFWLLSMSSAPPSRR
eukprot:GGOE01036537.1.p1 GENE.GGOE01036537.1~~GGOE01036537.1.p1  ORF type:complete len:658 (-),score=216.49 GGOE01036537.1:503-2446(-)